MIAQCHDHGWTWKPQNIRILVVSKVVCFFGWDDGFCLLSLGQQAEAEKGMIIDSAAAYFKIQVAKTLSPYPSLS